MPGSRVWLRCFLSPGQHYLQCPLKSANFNRACRRQYIVRQRSHNSDRPPCAHKSPNTRFRREKRWCSLPQRTIERCERQALCLSKTRGGPCSDHHFGALLSHSCIRIRTPLRRLASTHEPLPYFSQVDRYQEMKREFQLMIL